MCCDSGNDFKYSDINGSCEKCGSPTVSGEAFEVCNYSSVDCGACGSAPCNDSC